MLRTIWWILYTKNGKLQSDRQVFLQCPSTCVFYCPSKIPNCCNERSEDELVDGFGSVCNLKKDLLEYTRLLRFQSYVR